MQIEKDDLKKKPQDYTSFTQTLQSTPEEEKEHKIQASKEYIAYIKEHDKDAYEKYLSYATYLYTVPKN